MGLWIVFLLMGAALLWTAVAQAHPEDACPAAKGGHAIYQATAGTCVRVKAPKAIPSRYTRALKACNANVPDRIKCLVDHINANGGRVTR